MEPKTIVVVGSANLDLVFRARKLPRPGETVIGATFATHPGGKGANQAVAVGRLGGRVAFVGCVGADASGEYLRQTLRGDGVNDSFLDQSELPTGTASIVVDEHAANMIVVASGANDSVAPSQVSAAFGHFQPTICLTQLEIPMQAVEAASHVERFILNPAPATKVPPEILGRCFAVTPNETEVELLTGIAPHDEGACADAAKALHDMGVLHVLITLGDRGCYWSGDGASATFSPPSVRAIDTTAAGDCFNGALAYALSGGNELPRAIEFANCAAALSTTRRGAMESMPTLAEVQALTGR